jgi:hypothetical protein
MENQKMFYEELLTIKELCERIKYKRQSIYNLIYKDKFILGIHFLKPSPKKILFKWSAISDWLGDKSSSTILTKDVSNPNDRKTIEGMVKESNVNKCKIIV